MLFDSGKKKKPGNDASKGSCFNKEILSEVLVAKLAAASALRQQSKESEKKKEAGKKAYAFFEGC